MILAYTGRLPEVEAMLRERATVVPFGSPVDLGVSALGEHLFTPGEIAQARLGIVNLHCAPLPEYRGRDCAARAIHDGARRYGVTLHYVDEGIDTGPIIAELRFGVPGGATVDDLRALARRRGIDLFAAVLPDLLGGRVAAYPQ